MITTTANVQKCSRLADIYVVGKFVLRLRMHVITCMSLINNLLCTVFEVETHSTARQPWHPAVWYTIFFSTPWFN